MSFTLLSACLHFLVSLSSMQCLIPTQWLKELQWMLLQKSALLFFLFSLFNIWQVWHFKVQCFHQGVEHSLRYFHANLLFFISRKPRSAGRWVLIFSLLSLSWSPWAKFLVCALMESLCCDDWDSCSQDFPAEGLANKPGKLRAMRKTESSLIPWLWHLLCERVLW